MTIYLVISWLRGMTNVCQIYMYQHVVPILAIQDWTHVHLV
jgi:hypothetical protein